ncbi:MAG: PA14 domain-containing protein [Gammaproteobacteria bacterium]
MACRPALAGGGPETTLVVVNGDSPLSVRIANDYVRLRDIPANHLVRLHHIPSLSGISIDMFRERIWGPIRSYLDSSGLAGQIDTITYSADFPYRVSFSADAPHLSGMVARYRGRVGSLTGLTYFARRVERRNTGYLGLRTNLYFRRDLSAAAVPPRGPTSTERSEYMRAERAFRRGAYPQAVDGFERFTQTFPWSGVAWFKLARSQAAAGKPDDALAALRQAVRSGWSDVLLAENDPHLRALHGRPDFRSLLRAMEARNGPFQPAHGFRSRYAWSGADDPVLPDAASGLDRYFLSTMLAYTGVRGNSMPEVKRYLASAAASDGTDPRGTVYLMVNRDVRARTREGLFSLTVRDLRALGQRARILHAGKDGQNGLVPVGKSDVIGVVAGARRFDWVRSGSRLLPGAIAESLTSYGAMFDNLSQTKLSEFLRYGAAGSSGAVAEPFSFAEKFPDPLLHVFYAQGCSLAEAFYQSIESPYQLLVVGDPLARPFAHFAKVSLRHPDAGRHWSGTVVIRAGLAAAAGHPIGHWGLWVDGQHLADAAVGQALHWNTRAVADGSHELRIVAVEKGPIETRSYGKFAIRVQNGVHELSLAPGPPSVRFGQPVVLSGTAAGATTVVVREGLRVLTTVAVEKGRWVARIDSRRLGIGASPVFAEASFPGGGRVRSELRTVHVQEPAPLPALADQRAGQPGLAALVSAGDGSTRSFVIRALNGDAVPNDAREPKPMKLRITGVFRVPATGFYELVAAVSGHLRIAVDGQLVGERAVAHRHSDVYLPVGLRAGWHALRIEVVSRRFRVPRVILEGDAEAHLLGGDDVRHAGG